MTKYESNIKHNAAPVERVYEKLSDLTNLRILQERMADPNFAEVIRQQAGSQVKPEQLEMIRERISQLQFDRDTVSTNVEQLGSNLTLRIVEREEPKLVKLAVENAPIGANLWIQLLPATDGGTKMKLTLGVDLNFFMRKMVEGKLKDGIERFADMLAMMPY